MVELAQIADARRSEMPRSLVLLALCSCVAGVPACLPEPVEDRTLGVLDEACSAELAAPERPAASALDADPIVRVSEAFPDWSGACASCIQSECAPFLERCAGEPGCVEFAACRWRDEEPSPASELRCSRAPGQSASEPGSAIRALTNCWQASCVEACRLGTHWSCVGAYSLPAPEADVAHVTQVLQQLSSDRPVSGARVRFCAATTPAEECMARFDAEGTTDAEGLAPVELPIVTDYRPGWSGYRYVLSEQHQVRLQGNLALTRDRFLLQHVPTIRDTMFLSSIFGADLGQGNIVFQVFDCARTGAARVELEVTRDGGEESVGARVLYQRGSSPSLELAPGGTQPGGEGGGAIMALPPGEWLRVKARRQCGGQIVAQLRVRTAPGELLLLELHPDGGN